MLLFPESGNRRRRRVVAAAALAGVAFALPCGIHAAHARTSPPVGALPPEPLATDHPIWRDLESLWNRGGLADLPLFTRPLVRADVARSYLATVAADPGLATLAPARRVEREFARELALLGAAPHAVPRAPLLSWTEGGATLRVESRASFFVRAAKDEVHLDEGTGVSAVFRVDFGERAFAASDVGVERILDASPLGDAIVKGTEWYMNTDRAGIVIRSSAADFALGLDRNRWGPGAAGTLLLSDAAPSYPGFSFARTFGARARFAAVTASLHAPERRWFSAHRLEVAVTPELHVGIHEAAAYASDGVDLLYATNLVPYTVVQRIFDRSSTAGPSIVSNRNNLMAGMDVVWRPLRALRFDAEILLDEVSTETSAIPHRWGLQLGAAWAGSIAGRSADARLEHAFVDPFTYAVFYGANFLHDDVPLGYSRGPDVEFTRATLDVDASTDLQLGLGLDRELDGRGGPGDFWDPDDPPRENTSRPTQPIRRTWFPHARARWTWLDAWDATARLGVRSVENQDHVPGRDDTAFSGELVARWKW